MDLPYTHTNNIRSKPARDSHRVQSIRCVAYAMWCLGLYAFESVYAHTSRPFTYRNFAFALNANWSTPSARALLSLLLSSSIYVHMRRTICPCVCVCMCVSFHFILKHFKNITVLPIRCYGNIIWYKTLLHISIVGFVIHYAMKFFMYRFHLIYLFVSDVMLAAGHSTSMYVICWANSSNSKAE